MSTSRRQLLLTGASLGAGLIPAHALARSGARTRSRHTHQPVHRGRQGELFQISLAQWSLHRTLNGGKLEPLAFPEFTRDTFDIDAVEYVNSFYKGKATDFAFLGELKKRADGAGVESLLIMIDGEGQLADPDDANRRKAIENHFKWIAAARFLGCHSIRVNAGGQGTREEMHGRAVDSLVRLGDMGEQYDINVIVENHGGLSSDGGWLAGVMAAAAHPRVGTLPDFGNFHMGDGNWYDRYKGVRELMPYAKAVSAKTYGFDESGGDVKTDYLRMLEIVVVAGYRGYVGIEWEGAEPGEVEGIQKTKELLVRVRGELASRGH